MLSWACFPAGTGPDVVDLQGRCAYSHPGRCHLSPREPLHPGSLFLSQRQDQALKYLLSWAQADDSWSLQQIDLRLCTQCVMPYCSKLYWGVTLGT